MRYLGGRSLDIFVKRMLLSMTLVLFFIQAVLPTGFMPDLGALRDGQIKIVVCTENGYQTLILDKEGNPTNPSEQDNSAKTHQCQFNAPGSKVFVQQVPALTTVVSFSVNAADFYPREFGLNYAIHSAPVGLRAPPVLLV